jgi:hypothetical protein
MLRDKTCLVLGAGASRPYLLPTSRELRHILLGGQFALEAFAHLGWNGGAANAARRHHASILEAGFTEGQLDKFRGEFFNAQRVSIDAFLAWRKDDFEEIGKFAIAAAILMCERRQFLNEDWYQWLLEKLVEDGPDFETGNLYIITFNYDRSFEFFFWRAFCAAFKVSAEKADELLCRIEIVHAYGDVGPLRIDQARPLIPGERIIPFGDAGKAGQATNWINIVAPCTLPPAADRIREIISECKRICFLGFGFWKENLDLLGDIDVKNKRVLASCYHLPRDTRREVLFRFGTTDEQRPTINFGNEDQDVMKFLTHWRVLT